MQKMVVKYSLIFLLILVYINRSLFIVPCEFENYDNKETNSVIEWIVHLVTGEGNDIDEDGDLNSDCHSAKTVSFYFYQEFAQYLDRVNVFSKNAEKVTFSNKENGVQKGFYTQIDQPPKA